MERRSGREKPLRKARSLGGNKFSLAQLIARGRASSPKGDLLELEPPEGEPSTAASDALIEDRADRL